jgi:hypothetical protein
MRVVKWLRVLIKYLMRWTAQTPAKRLPWDVAYNLLLVAIVCGPAASAFFLALGAIPFFSNLCCCCLAHRPLGAGSPFISCPNSGDFREILPIQDAWSIRSRIPRSPTSERIFHYRECSSDRCTFSSGRSPEQRWLVAACDGSNSGCTADVSIPYSQFCLRC